MCHVVASGSAAVVAEGGITRVGGCCCMLRVASGMAPAPLLRCMLCLLSWLAPGRLGLLPDRYVRLCEALRL